MSALSGEVRKLIVSETQMRADMALLPFDLWASRAHVCMLAKCKIIQPPIAAALIKALDLIDQAVEGGEFQIDPERGAQLSLEAEVIRLAGEQAGLSLHTARSRNDQIMVAESLFTRHKALAILEALPAVQQALLDLAKTHIHTVMPGYTHMQPAKPTSFASWCLAYFDSMERCAKLLRSKLEIYDLSPLGSVESFGTTWPIDREYTAKLLGFKQVWEIPQDAISQRGFFQLEILSALNQLGINVSKFAQDLMLYSTHEYRMVSFDDRVAQRLHPITGSSVMAQKRNPDALELLRSLSPQLASHYQALSGLLAGLPSGYNRDPREGKEYFQAALDKSASALAAMLSVVPALLPDKQRMRELVIENYSLTTDFADQLALKNGLPYRKVYKVVGRFVDGLISEKRSLATVSAAELESFASQQDLKLKVDAETLLLLTKPEHVLSLRKHSGGSAESEVLRLSSERAAIVEASQLWCRSMRESITQAKRETLLASEKFSLS